MAKKFFLEKRLECMMTNPKDIRKGNDGQQSLFSVRKRWLCCVCFR